MDQPERASIRPEDWPLEEGGEQAQDALRNDTGTSQGRPKQETLERTGASASGDERQDEREYDDDVVGRDRLGSLTPGSKGSEQGPR